MGQDWGWNLQPFGYRTTLQATEAHWPGPQSEVFGDIHLSQLGRMDKKTQSSDEEVQATDFHLGVT